MAQQGKGEIITCLIDDQQQQRQDESKQEVARSKTEAKTGLIHHSQHLPSQPE